MMDVKVSKDEYITRWADWENFIYVKNCWSTEEKEARHYVE